MHFLLGLFLPAVLAAGISESHSLAARDTPANTLGVYLQTFHEPNSKAAIDLTKIVDTGVNNVIVCTFHTNEKDGKKQLLLNKAPTSDNQFKNLRDAVHPIQKAGITIQGMMGGSGQSSFSKGICSDNAFQDDWYDEVTAAIKALNLQGFELDIEEAADETCIVTFLTKLRQDHGDKFLITMAPIAGSMTGGMDKYTKWSYKDLDKKAQHNGKPIIDGFNVQFYDDGGSFKVDTYSKIVDAGFKEERVSASVLTSATLGKGFSNVDTLVAAIKELKDKFPKFRGINGWEYFTSGLGDTSKALVNPGTTGATARVAWTKVVSNAMAATS